MLSNVTVIPTQANRIRALKAAEPKLSVPEIALKLKLHRRVVSLALEQGDTRRIKSVAK